MELTRAGSISLGALGVLLALGMLARARRRAGRAAATRIPRVAVIVVTSPAPCHPSTRLMECLLDSISEHMPALLGVPLTIVCDGVKVGSADRLKRGICTPELAARYGEYVCRLRELVARGDRPWCANATVVQLSSRNGFGFAVRQGLLFRESRHVIVLQHDRPFVRGFDLDGVLGAMETCGDRVKYVCLPSRSTHAHPLNVLGRHQLRLPAAAPFGRVSLAPLAFWYDSTHVVSRRHYLEHVFGYGREEPRVRRGQFPEETLGTTMMTDICAHGMEAHAKYGTWVLVDGLAPAGTAPAKGHARRRERSALYDAGHARLALARGQGERLHEMRRAPDSDSDRAFVPVVVHSDGRSDRWCDGHAERVKQYAGSRYPGLPV